MMVMGRGPSWSRQERWRQREGSDGRLSLTGLGSWGHGQEEPTPSFCCCPEGGQSLWGPALTVCTVSPLASGQQDRSEARSAMELAMQVEMKTWALFRRSWRAWSQAPLSTKIGRQPYSVRVGQRVGTAAPRVTCQELTQLLSEEGRGVRWASEVHSHSFKRSNSLKRSRQAFSHLKSKSHQLKKKCLKALEIPSYNASSDSVSCFKSHSTPHPSSY